MSAHIDISVSDIIQFPLQAVWNKLIAFDEFSDFHHGSLRSFYLRRTADLQGSIRKIDMPDSAYVEELLVKVDHAHHYMEYVIVQSSLPLIGYRAEIRLYPVSEKQVTFMQWCAEFNTDHPSPDALAEQIKQNVFVSAMRGLENYLQEVRSNR